MEIKIKSVEKGFGEGSIFFSASPKVVQPFRVDEIKQEFTQTSIEGDGYPTYVGYINGKKAFKMGDSIDVTVTFWTE